MSLCRVVQLILICIWLGYLGGAALGSAIFHCEGLRESFTPAGMALLLALAWQDWSFSKYKITRKDSLGNALHPRGFAHWCPN